jgi:hypothetical protein
VPIAFVPKLPDRNVHDGVAASALSVRQTPPPAAATHTRHDVVPHAFESTASAVTRPETPRSEAWLSKKFRTAGCVAVDGPASCQPLVDVFVRPLTVPL